MSVGLVAMNSNGGIRKPTIGLSKSKNNFSIDSIMSSHSSKKAEIKHNVDHGSKFASRESPSFPSPPPLISKRLTPSPDTNDLDLSKVSVPNKVTRTNSFTDNKAYVRDMSNRLPHHNHHQTTHNQSPPSSPSESRLSHKAGSSTPPYNHSSFSSQQPLPEQMRHSSHLQTHLEKHPSSLSHPRHINGIPGLKTIPAHFTPPYHPSQLSALEQINALYAQQNGIAGLSTSSLPCSPFGNGSGVSPVPLAGLHKQFSPLQLPVYAPWQARPGLMYPSFPGSDPGFLLPFRKPKRIRTAFSPSQLLKLEHAFEKNHYVVGQERKELAAALSLTETQVKVWFQNRRTKFKRVRTDNGEYVTVEDGDHSDPEDEEDELNVDDDISEGYPEDQLVVDNMSQMTH